MVGLTYAGGLPGELGKRWPSWSASTARRGAAARKLAIYREAHLELVNAKIDQLLGGGQVAADIKRFAHRSPNVLKAVADAIGVAYRSGCTRSLRGVSPEVARAFADCVTESGITRKAAGLNAASWVAGPHFVSPYLTSRGAVALDVVGPDRLDAEMQGEDVKRVLWKQGNSYVLLDASGWSYYDSNGEPTGGDVAHAVGRCPAVPFVSFDGGPDFWAQSAHDGLADVTLVCGYKIAWMLYARQVSGVPLTTVFADLEKLPPGQVLGSPVTPLLLQPDHKLQVDSSRVVSAADYLSEVSALITMAVSIEGLPPGSVTLVANNSDWGNLGISAEGPRLAAHRDRQVPWLLHSERELWPVVCDLVRGSTHKHARVLPPGDEVRDILRVEFPDLSSPDEQLKRIQVMALGLPYGLSSPVDVPLAARPELTREEVDETQRANLEAYIARIEPLVSRNIPGQAPDAPGHQTIAQQQGRQGGIASGETRAAAAQENANP